MLGFKRAAKLTQNRAIFNLAQRGFAAQGVVTRELAAHLEKLGINHNRIVQNPTVGELYEYAMDPIHKASVGD
jgi:hypothetical protein